MDKSTNLNHEDEGGQQRPQSPPNGGTPNVSGTSVPDSGNVNSFAVSRPPVPHGDALGSSTPGETTFEPLFDPEGNCYGVDIKGDNIRWGLGMTPKITTVIDEQGLDSFVIPKHFMTEGGRRIFVVPRAVEVMADMQSRRDNECRWAYVERRSCDVNARPQGVRVQRIQLYKRKGSECPHCDYGGTIVVKMFWEDGKTEIREMTYPDLSGMLFCTDGQFVVPDQRFTFPSVEGNDADVE